MMKPEHFDWLTIPENKLMLTSSVRVSKEQKQELYNIYNDITGEKKKPNGCGRCLGNVIKMIKHYYDRYTKIE